MKKLTSIIFASVAMLLLSTTAAKAEYKFKQLTKPQKESIIYG